MKATRVVSLVVMFVLVTSCAWRASGQDVSLTVVPILPKVRPGVAAPVIVSLHNRVMKEISIPDFYAVPFYGPWSWEWKWNEGEKAYPITARDTSLAVPLPRKPRTVRIEPGGTYEWFGVIPVPDVFEGADNAKLIVSLMQPELTDKISASADFSLGDAVRPRIPPQIDRRYVQPSLATGLGRLMRASLGATGALEALHQASLGDDDLLTLAWFCIELGGDRFDADAWAKISSSSGDYRAIRDVNLYQALMLGRIRLTPKEATAVEKHIEGEYPFSEAMIESVRKSTN